MAYVLVGGCAEVKQNGRVLARIGPRSVVGELSLLDGGRSTVTVITLTRVELAVITRRSLTCCAISAPVCEPRRRPMNGEPSSSEA
jgi:CRP-like cAMP-binding protein